MRIIEVHSCFECPYRKFGKPPYCMKFNFDVQVNEEEIHKNCTLKTMKELVEKISLHTTVQDVVNQERYNDTKKSIRDLINEKSETNNNKEEWKDEDGWWDVDQTPIIATNTDQNCILCGNLLNGDETKDMDIDNKVVKVHTVCYDNVQVLIDANKDEVTELKETNEKIKKESDGDWNNGW